jgi:hypothetical protein
MGRINPADVQILNMRLEILRRLAARRHQATFIWDPALAK